MRPDFTERVKYLLIEPLKKPLLLWDYFFIAEGVALYEGELPYIQRQDVDEQINFIMVSQSSDDSKYSQTCIKRSPLVQRKSHLTRQVTS